MSQPTFALFRIIHVVSGAFWFGAVVVGGAFLLPAVRRAGPAGGAVMEQLLLARFPVFINLAVLLSVLSGLPLYRMASAGSNPAWMRSVPGMVLNAGVTLAVIAVLIGVFVNRPAANRIGQLMAAAKAAGGPPAPEVLAEVGRLQLRLMGATRITAVLVALAAAAMVSARFLG